MPSTSPPPPKTTAPPSNAVVRGASLLIALQLLSRLATFAANQLLLRLLTAPLLGLAAQLDVYYLSVLFFARDSLRVAVQRQGVGQQQQQQPTPKTTTAANKKTNNDGTAHDATTTATTTSRDAAERRESQAVVNLGYLAVPLGIILAIVFAWLYTASATTTTLQAPYLVVSLRIYGVAAVAELLSEPCFVLMQTRLRFGTRAAAESIATVLRCAVVFASASWAARNQDRADLGVLPFALGQLVYGLALLAVYAVSAYRLASSSGFSLLPKAVASSADTDFFASYLYRPTLTLAGSMMAQGLVKHLLTQGDTFLVSLLSAPDVQGVYALVANYGGLLARLLFQPVEESSRSYFSRLLSATTDAATSSSSDKPSPAVREAKTSLQTLLRLYALLSSVVVALGPPAATPLLAIVAGRQWIGAGAGGVLAAYCFYVPLLALNGATESFVASVASEAQVHRQSAWMGAFSVVFAAAAFVFMRVLGWGAGGLVAANAINMLCRVVWSVAFIKDYFGRHGVAFDVAALVPGGVLAASLSTLFVVYNLDVVAQSHTAPFMTLVKVGASALPLLLLMYVVTSTPQPISMHLQF